MRGLTPPGRLLESKIALPSLRDFSHHLETSKSLVGYQLIILYHGVIPELSSFSSPSWNSTQLFQPSQLRISINRFRGRVRKSNATECSHEDVCKDRNCKEMGMG